VTAGGPHPWIIINALREAFGDIAVVEEQAESRSAMIRRRIRKFGLWNGLGQTAMMAWSVLGKRLSRRRIERLIREEQLEATAHPEQRIIQIPSVNSERFAETIDQLKPAVVFLVGCGVLKAATLARIPCPVLNYHAGITPKYRGMNGGYFAMAEGDDGNFGGTVHLVDAGVDTGAVLYQARSRPKPDDDFLTYAYRLAALSRPICVQAVRDALDGTLTPVATDLPSRQWFHPTIWRYLWTGLTRKVW